MDRASWLEQRKQYLGASEVPAVCGLDPFKTALDVWAIKKGLTKDESSIAADMGNLFEDPLLSYYAAKHGRKLVKPGTLTRSDFAWMAATPDSITECRRNVQVKVVGRWMVDRWDDGAPDYTQVQCQWEMHVADLGVTDVVACLGGTDYKEFEVKRDDEVIGHLVEICSRFWRDHIEGDRMPEVDGSESATRVLGAKFPKPTAGMEEAVPELVEMALRYKEIGRAVATVKEEQKTLANAMRLAIGDRQGLKWPGGYVSWKTDKQGARRLYVHTKGAGQ